MDSPRPAVRHRRRRRTAAGLLSGGFALAATFALTACDSKVGIEGTDYGTETPRPAAAPATTARPTAPPAATPTGAAPGPVAAVPGNPAAARAVARWAADLQRLSIAELQTACWTMAPGNVTTMYADAPAILDALGRAGTDTETAAVWQNGTTTVVAQHIDIEAGYACPRVYPAGSGDEPTSGVTGFTEADARHTVRRYLARLAGKPLDPADVEGTHPLLCAASPATWDPTGSGEPAAPPLTSDPGRAITVKSFADQAITSRALRADYVAVTAQVVDTTGATQTVTVTLKATGRGYCIGDMSL